MNAEIKGHLSSIRFLRSLKRSLRKQYRREAAGLQDGIDRARRQIKELRANEPH